MHIWPCKDPVVLCQNGSARSWKGRWLPSYRALGLEWQVRAGRGQGVCVTWLLKVGNRQHHHEGILLLSHGGQGWSSQKQACKSFVISIATPTYPLAMVNGNSSQGTHLLCTLLFINSLVLYSWIHSFPCWCQAGWCLIRGDSVGSSCHFCLCPLSSGVNGHLNV